PECQTTDLRGGAVCDHLTVDDLVTELDYRLLVEVGVLVRTLEPRQLILGLDDLGAFGDYPVGVDVGDGACRGGEHHGAGVTRDTLLDTGADERGLGLD